MSDLIVIAFDDETTAFAMRAELAKMQKEYLIDMGDVVVVTKDDKGKVKLHQAQNLTALGAVSGGFWGMLIGLIFLSPLLGAMVGAGAAEGAWREHLCPEGTVIVPELPASSLYHVTLAAAELVRIRQG